MWERFGWAWPLTLACHNQDNQGRPTHSPEIFSCCVSIQCPNSCHKWRDREPTAPRCQGRRSWPTWCECAKASTKLLSKRWTDGNNGAHIDIVLVKENEDTNVGEIDWIEPPLLHVLVVWTRTERVHTSPTKESRRPWILQRADTSPSGLSLVKPPFFESVPSDGRTGLRDQSIRGDREVKSRGQRKWERYRTEQGATMGSNRVQ